MAPQHKIVSVRVNSMYESCQRTTFYVQLTTDEGFTLDPMSYRTGSIYTDFEGLTLEEARDRALIDAHNWADFLGLTVEPFIVDGVEIKPTMTFDSYTMRREMRAEKESA